MKKIIMALFLVFVCTSQLGFAASRPNPANLELGEEQVIFYRMTVAESTDIDKVDGMAYYPAEKAVYLLELGSDYTLNANTTVVSESGFLAEPDHMFARTYLYDFEVEGEEGYILYRMVGELAMWDKNNNRFRFPSEIKEPYRFANFEIRGNRMVVLEYDFETYEISPFKVYELPNPLTGYSQPIEKLSYLNVIPYSYDLSADGQSVVVFGPSAASDQKNISEDMEIGTDVYLEILPIPTESIASGALSSPAESDGLPVQIKNYAKDQALLVRDMYTTEDHIVVLIHDELQDRSFIQRYTYGGKVVNQLETNSQTRRMTSGPDGSTLYLQKRYLENDERKEGFESGDFQLEIIRMNWGEEQEFKKATTTGRMQAMIAERTFGGRTIARFADKGFGLIKQIEEETGIVDYRAPLRSSATDVRLQIPYADLMARAGMGARDLVLIYQGQAIAIPFDLLLSADVNEMPCQDDATIEIHLQMDEEGNVSYTIELFVVDQVNAMTRVVHRKTIQ